MGPCGGVGGVLVALFLCPQQDSPCDCRQAPFYKVRSGRSVSEALQVDGLMFDRPGGWGSGYQGLYWPQML